MAQTEEKVAAAEEEKEEESQAAGGSEIAGQPAQDANSVVVAIGTGLGKTTRVLGEQSKSFWKGSRDAIVKAAKGVGTGVRKLEEKSRKRAIGGDLAARAERVRQKQDECLLQLGREVFQAHSGEGTTIELSDAMRAGLAKARDGQAELDGIQKAIDEARQKAAAKTAEAESSEIEAEGVPVTEAGEAGEQAAAPAKKGKGKRAKAQAEAEPEPAAEQPEAAAEPEAAEAGEEEEGE